MTILVIGTGAIGKRHFNNLIALGEDAIALSYREMGLEGVQKTLMSQKFEAAFICTASQERLDIVTALAAHDIPFYLEKPVAYTAETLAAIYDAVGDLGARCFAGFMMRYHPAVQYLATQDLSDIYRYHFEIGQDVNQWRENWSFADSYAAKADGGGVLLDLCHEIDVCKTLFPDAELTAVNSTPNSQFPGVDFASFLLMQGSAIGTVAMDYLSPVSVRRHMLRGRKTNYEFDLGADNYQKDNGSGAETLGLVIDRQEMFREATRDFLRLVRGQEMQNPLAPTLAATLASSTLICQAYHSRQFVE
jgi:predicted dehydrogenase